MCVWAPIGIDTLDGYKRPDPIAYEGNPVKKVFEKVLSGYRRAISEEVFTGHELANHLRKEAGKSIAEEAKLDLTKYIVSGSAGQSRWAQIPWIAVFDKDITTSAAEGYDIVYLFTADMSGVYLSLNQGWTYFRDKYGFKKGRANIAKVSQYWRNELASALDDFRVIDIDLQGKKSGLAGGYELGHICGKFYPADDLPDNDSMVNDLRNLLGVYRELKGKLGGSSIEDFNVQIVTDIELGSQLDSDSAKENDKSQRNKSTKIAAKLVEASESIEMKEASPPAGIGRPSTTNPSSPRKIDFETKTRTQAKVGLAGEKAIFRHEQAQLAKEGRNDLARRVIHTSLTNDSAGYDIRSFFPDGREHFIEVKSTAGSAEEPFYISASEVRFSQDNPDQYSVYRVFGMDLDQPTWNFFRYPGEISNHVQLAPTAYKATLLGDNLQ